MKKQAAALLLALSLLLSACSAPAPAAVTPAPAPVEAEPAPAAAPAPTAEPEATAEPAPVLLPEETGVLRISELMNKNRATLAAADGSFYDWIEVENISSGPLSLAGWSISDGADQTPWPLPERTLAPGECCLIFAAGKDAAGEDMAPFALSAGESACLFAPSGALADSMDCPELSADLSCARTADGDAAACLWPSPGYSNTDEGYAAFAASREAAGPLAIWEVMVANVSFPARRDAQREDWVEIRNISEGAVDLSDYYLWDGSNEDEPFRLPAVTLSKGESFVVVCGGDGADDAPFSLSADKERLYLGNENGLSDYCALHDLPIDGSFGRLEGQGFFYFAKPTPGGKNGEGCRMVSAAPEALTEDGVFNGVEAVEVALRGAGTIYYSTDGSRPDAKAKRYEPPLSLSKTTVVRAVCIEEGKLPSRVLTLNYIINENHTLPVLSLSTDEPGSFRGMYAAGAKGRELPGCLSFYDDAEGLYFKQACGVKMSGSGSLELDKKSMAIMFRSCYGDGSIDCDLFGTGISKYASLHLRAGEAYPTTIIQSDMFQDICLEMSDDALTQHSKFCVLYVNGSYYGIFAMKEKFSEQYYASLKGVSKESVTVVKYPAGGDTDFYNDVVLFCRNADLTDPAQYETFCSRVNIDSLIDWYLIEGISGNSDIGGNLRLFRSTEDGGRWSFALYDLDWSFNDSDFLFYNLYHTSYYHSGQFEEIMNKAMENEEFRDHILSRYAAVWDKELSNERFLRQIDYYEELLTPEVPRERDRWGGGLQGWQLRLDMLREFIEDVDPQHLALLHFCQIWNVSEETRKQYFGW